ncbi:hypothetical protein SAMN05444412_11745 [Rhodonellum ikkaensis]|uniref:Uncharacterized protein n=1 Tax=Rhodonellum ikkaensis TaxID=336829 RepID=A0A1H3TFJ1_9BACT|nr:hypothetical protein SAMN05444412_11745 [Rhodonellum ikkaensis]
MKIRIGFSSASTKIVHDRRERSLKNGAMVLLKLGRFDSIKHLLDNDSDHKDGTKDDRSCYDEFHKR